MAALRQLLTVPLALISFVCTFYAVGKLMFFLSAPQKIHIASVWVINLLDNRAKIDLALLPITIDTILVVFFILQHSLLRTDFVKSIWAAIGLESAERSIYNLATAGTLLVSADIISAVRKVYRRICSMLCFFSVFVETLAASSVDCSVEC